MVKIAICDDDVEICSLIESILLEYAALNALKIESHIFYSGENLLQCLNDGDNFDLIYLDIEMEGIERDVAKYRFILIHRSYLINYQHVSIRRYSEVVMSNGAILPISRSKSGFISRKKGKGKHGLGLKSIESIIQKYDGVMQIVHDEKQFKTKVLLYVMKAFIGLFVY